MNKLAELFVELSLKSSQYTQGLTALVGRSATMGAQIGRRLASAAVRAAQVGLVGLTTLLAGLGVASIQAASSFEAQMSNVQAALQASGQEMEGLTELARGLALDPGLSVSAQDAAASFELLARNGVSSENIMGGMGRAAITLTNSTVGANATIQDFATTADVLTDAMVLFGLEADQAGTAIDSITGVINNSKFDISSYQTALSSAAGSAAGLGLSLEDTNSILALIAPRFGDVGAAGTSLNRALVSLASPSSKAMDAMAALGIEVFDSQGNFIGAKGAIEELSGAFDGLSQQQRVAAATDIAGTFGFRALLGLADSSAEAFDELSGKVNALGNAENAASTRVDNFKGALNLLRDTAESLLITFGTPFIEGFTGDIRNAADVLKSFAPQVQIFAEDLYDRIANIQSAFASGGLSGLFSELGIDQSRLDTINTVTEAVRNFFNFISENRETVISALQGIGVALAGLAAAGAITVIVATLASIVNPVTLIVAAVGLLAVAWNNDFLGMKTALTDFWANTGKPIFDNLSKIFNETLLPALQEFSTFWTENMWPIISTALSDAWGAIKEILDSLGLSFDGDLVTSVTNFATNWAENWANVLGSIQGNWDKIKPIFEFLVEQLTGLPEKLVEMQNSFSENWRSASSDVTDAWAKIKPIFDRIREFAAFLASTVFNFKINLPKLPDWATPGSPIPLHTRWREFGNYLNQQEFEPDFNLAPAQNVLDTLESINSASQTIRTATSSPVNNGSNVNASSGVGSVRNITIQEGAIVLNLDRELVEDPESFSEFLLSSIDSAGGGE